MKVPAHVAAVSARTPIGMTAETSAAAARAGISAIGEHPFFVDGRGEPLRGVLDSQLDPARMGWERLAALTELPLRTLGEQLAAQTGPSGPVRLLLAVPEHRPGWTAADEQALVESLQCQAIPGLGNLEVSVVERGHAGVHRGLEVARDQIGSRGVELCIVGGVESYFEPQTLGWLADHRQLKTDQTRSSFFPGEGAAFVAVTSADECARLSLPPLASIEGAGTATETQLIKTDCNNLGHALAHAVLKAASSIQPDQQKIDAVWSDINGERYRTEEWGFTILRTQHLFENPTDYEAPTGLWGDQGAATGALAVVLATERWRRAGLPGTLGMLLGGSEAGLRSAVLIRRLIGE